MDTGVAGPGENTWRGVAGPGENRAGGSASLGGSPAVSSWELGLGLRMMSPPWGMVICLYGCWNCFRPAAITASSFGRSRSISVGFGPDTGRLRFFNSILRSVTFMSSSLLSREVAWLTS